MMVDPDMIIKEEPVEVEARPEPADPAGHPEDRWDTAVVHRECAMDLDPFAHDDRGATANPVDMNV